MHEYDISKYLLFLAYFIFQEDYRPEEEEEEDEGNADAGDNDDKSFFAPSDGIFFHVDSFLHLNLPRPLLRACQALGYIHPTPIQVLHS